MHQTVFYKTGNGAEPVLDWLRSLSKEDRLVVGEDLRTVQIGFPIGLPVCRPLGDGLYEVRSSLPSRREARLIFFHHSRLAALMVLHGFIKTTRATPKADLALARRRRNEYGP